MITRISLVNFKGHNRAFDFGAATMIVGDNFKGKSGLFQALALGVHGWLKHPGGDKKLDPFGLASGNPMSVELHSGVDDHGGLNPNQSISRQWTQDKKGSVRYFGYEGEPLMPPILMDARTYFDMSADKRMRYVFGAVKLSDGAFSSDKLIADLKNLKVDPMTEVHQVALKEVVRLVAYSWDFNEQEKVNGGGVSLQEWLTQVIDMLKEQAKLAKQAVTRMAQTVAGITELQVRDTTEIDANTSALETKMQGIREKIGTLQAELGKLKSRGEIASKKLAQATPLVSEFNALPAVDESLLAQEAQLLAERDRLAVELNTLNKELGRLESEVAKRKDLNAKQVELAHALECLDGQLAAQPDQGENMKHWQSELDRRQNEARDLVESIAKAKDTQSKIGNEWSGLKALHLRVGIELEEVKKKLNGLSTLEECPYCSCAGDTFKTAAKAHFNAHIAMLELQLSNIEKEITEKSDRSDSLMAQIESLKNESKYLNSTIESTNKTVKECDSKQRVRANLLTRREELLKQVWPLHDISAADFALVTHRNVIAASASESNEIASKLKSLASMKRAQEIIAQLADAPENVDALRAEYARIKLEIENLNAEFNACDVDVKRGVAAKADVLRQNQAVVERDKAKAEQDMTNLAVDAVTAFQQSMVNEAFRTIITDANRFTEGILDSPLVYQDGEIGRIRNSVFIGHEYLSGTEQALCFAAISVALAMQSPFRLVQIDELTRLSRRNKQLVFGRLVSLIEQGVIHQTICVDTDIAPYRELNIDPEMATFIEL